MALPRENSLRRIGERDKAVVMAKEAAAGGSVEGLSILAWLDERMHLLTDAQHIWEQMDENMPYPSFGAYKGWATFPFYVRHQDEKNEYKLEVEEISKTFAHGFVKFKKEDLASPPTYGGTVYDAKPLAKSYGINDGCIVVAVDGYRVANMADLRRNRSIEPLKKEVEVVVWDGKKYETVNAAPPDRKYGFLLHEWNAK
jgi:hypothetical protein